MDGVAERQRLTPLDTRADERQAILDPDQQVAQHTKGRVGRPDGAARASVRPIRPAAHRSRFHDRRESLHGAARGWIDGRSGADIVDGALERGDLRGQLAGGIPVAVVFHSKRDRRRRQILQIRR